MAERQVKVRFLPSGATVKVTPGATVREAAADAAITLDVPCGGQGNCGKCKIQITAGKASERTNAERTLLNHEDVERGVRLACQTRVISPLTVFVPETSLVSSSYQILTEFRARAAEVADRPIRIVQVQLDAPTLKDDASDVDRLERVLGPLDIGLDVLRRLGLLLRGGGFRGTAILRGKRLLAFIGGDSKPRCLAAAFDIGTTTLAASLVDLEDGREVARASRLNPQVNFGDDVLARIVYAGGAPAQLDRLHRDVIRAVNEMLVELSQQAKARVDEIYEVVFAGNTTMQHLLLGIDPSPIGVTPFTPALSGPFEAPAADLGIHAHSNAPCCVFPVISGYVGGDTVAGMVATRLHAAERPALFMDIGTNGEIVVSTEDRLVATSCAAGPAFEGARIAHGMRAAAGAIEAVHIEEDVAYKVIGGEKPLGLCGSGLIDLVAELLRLGVISQTGALLSADETSSKLPSAVRRRIRWFEDEVGFALVEAEHAQLPHPIVLYQRDVRQVQLATAAVRSAVRILLERTGLQAGQLKHVLIAGAFGNYIRCVNAQRIGLLPPEVEGSRVDFVGNTSLAGARLAALSDGVWREAHTLARNTMHVDLSLDPNFQDTYVESLFFPDSGD